MRRKILNAFFAVCLTASLAVGLMPAAKLHVKAAEDISSTLEEGLVIQESEINKLLTGNLVLPTSVKGLSGAKVTYSVDSADAKYVSVEGNTLKVTRPFAGQGDYKFKLKATVTTEDGSGTGVKEFPLTVREGLSDDSYAGYVYVCFTCTSAEEDVQQVHFFLSQDGLNWTALNGCKPAFLVGTDYMDKIEAVGGRSVNYEVKEGTDLAQTVSGDASVLFPFEGDDQGIRDPYLIRGSKADGSDSNKVWILATDLNTHDSKYGGNKANNSVGNWGTMSTIGSTKLFIYETEDWIHWTRRWIDVGGEVDARMAWAPEAIYNPEKDNYLVYWSARTNVDGGSRDRLYCNETSDFVNFGPTKLYESEPFYENYGTSGRGNNSGYGNIDTSQLWVAGKDKDGNDTPYGTLFRLVKDETNNHIELMSADTVLDPAKDYAASNPINITPYSLDGKSYASLSDLSSLNDTNDIKRAQIVHNWFINESTGNHFKKISQTGIEQYTGAYEGATMFKFIDRDEWCVMIDHYVPMTIRYEPYTTTDLSVPDSIQKVTSDYGRTGGDIGCHGGMIPITVKEYNTMIDVYNSDPTVNNYHPLDYIAVDNRELGELSAELKSAAADTAHYSSSVVAQMNKLAAQAEDFLAKDGKKENISSDDIDRIADRARKLINNKIVEVSQDAKGVQLNKDFLTLCTKNTGGLKSKAALTAKITPADAPKNVTWKSSNTKVAAVNSKGVVTAKKQGEAIITARTPNGVSASCVVEVKGVPGKIKLNKTKATLKVKKTLQLKVTIPDGTVCSKFTYKSNKPKIASVSASGKITAKKKGTAKITVWASNNKKAKATITVKVK